MNRVSVYDYSDYRSFLNSVLQDRKSVKSDFSVGMWAKRMGLESTTSLNMILRGQRNPGRKILRRMESYFNFTPKEALYFDHLVDLAKTHSDGSEKLYLMEQLKKLHPKGEFHLLNEDEFSCMSNWYFFAIREMVKLKDFQEDISWISLKLKTKVKPKQIKEAIQTMLRVGLLDRNRKTKKLEIVHKRYTTSDDIASEALKRFHEQMLKRSIESIRNVNVEKREITGSTLSIPTENMEKAKKLIRNFQDEFCKLVEADKNSDAVYQLNVQFFPLTKEEFQS